MTRSQRICLAGSVYATGGALWFVLAGVQAVIRGIEPLAGLMAFYVVEAIFVIVHRSRSGSSVESWPPLHFHQSSAEDVAVKR